MTSLADVVRAYTASPLPVLFLDTCVLLDVVRAPARERGPDTVRAGSDLVAGTGQPARVYLVITDVVEAEWTTNLDNAKRDRDSAVGAFLRFNELIPLAGTLPGVVPATLPPASNPVAQIVAHLENLSRTLLGRATRLDRDPGCLVRAVERQLRTPPVRPAKGSSKGPIGAKDCVILEHALALSRGLGPS